MLLPRINGLPKRLPVLLFLSLLLLSLMPYGNAVPQSTETSSSNTVLSRKMTIPTEKQIPSQQTVLQSPENKKSESAVLIQKEQEATPLNQEHVNLNNMAPVASAQPEQSVQPTQDMSPAEISKPLTDRVESLEQLYIKNREEREKFTSTSYLLKIFGILTALLALFYLSAKFIISKFMSSYQSQPLVPFGKKENDFSAPPSKKPFLHGLFSQNQKQEKKLKLQLVSRLRIAPNKEIQVIQFGDRQIVIGVTAQNMTLLADIPSEADGHQSNAIFSESITSEQSQTVPDKAIYQKYLSKRSIMSNKKIEPSIPQEEEVYLLDDYEDQYERS